VTRNSLFKVALALIAASSQAKPQEVSWCVQNPELRLGLVSVSAGELAKTIPKWTGSDRALRQIYAGVGLECGSFDGIQMLHPQPTYALLKSFVLGTPRLRDITRVSYLGDDIVVDRLADGRVERKVVQGDEDSLNLNVRPYASTILHVNILKANWNPTGGRLVVFVKTSGPLAPSLGKTIFEAVEMRLGAGPWAVYIRNDVFFVERGFPLKYFFSEVDLPSVEEHKGTVTMTCSRRKDGIACSRTWE
jgi:hypothetical protein